MLEKTYLQQKDKVSTCMVKIGQEALTWRAEMKKLMRLTADKGVSSKANDTVWEKKKNPNTTQINKAAVNSICYS
jgi:hypothetical protein